VLAETDAKRAAVLANLPRGCEAWYELELAERFRADKALGAETEELITDFENAFPQAAEQWRLRLTFLKAGKQADGSEEQRKSIKELMPHLGIHLSSGYAAAATAGRGTETGDAAVTGTSCLPADVLPTKELLVEQFESGDRDIMRRLPARYLADVDFRKVRKDDDFCYFVRSRKEVVPLVASNASFLERVKSLFASGKKTNALQDFLKVLSLQQLESLSGSCKDLLSEADYVQAVMLRRFPDAFDPDASNLFTHEERRDKLMELADFVLGLNQSGPGHSLQVLLSQILLEVLQLHVQMNSPSKKALLLYLEELRKASVNSESTQRRLVPRRIDRVELPLISSSPEALGLKKGVMEQPPVREHLRAFIMDEEFWTVVKPLLPVDDLVLKRFRDEVTLLTGKQLTVPNTDPEWVQSLTEKSSLDLLPHNKERFDVEESVTLSVRLKNVPRLMVRIYEINVENYYVHHQKPFASDISLDGIGATVEVEHEFSQPPIVEHEEELTFAQLAGKQGLYVLDFIGADMRSRVVVRKGTLSLIHRTTPIGHIAYILAPDRSVVQSGARLCLEGRWYESDPGKGGRIIVPYGKTKSRLKVIMSALGMAQFSEFERFSEQYSMKAAFLLANESVVMGQNARLLIQPKLFCCGRSCDLKLIKKLEVSISMRSGTENVPTVRTFSDFSLDNGNLEIQFLVPNKLRTIEASLNVEVFNHCKQEFDKLAAARSWRVDDLSAGVACYELFLSRGKSGFEVKCLGKDGEPRPGMSVSLTLCGLISTDASLVTDERGSVQLGPLPDVQTVLASVAGVVRCWALPAAPRVKYPTQIDMLEGEALELPIDLRDAACTSLVELAGSQEQPLASRTESNVTLVPASAGAEVGSLKISALQRGSYRLLIGDWTILVKVHRGSKWQDDYVLRHDAILEYKERPKILAISSAEAGPTGVSAKLMGFTPNTKVHAFGLRFLPSDILDLVNQLMEATADPAHTTKFPFQMWKNIFLSNVKLGDEFGYVLRRRKATAQVGNMLKRPNLLLQPRAVKETTFAQEVVSVGRNFEQCQEEAGRMPCMAQANFMPAMQQMCMPMGGLAAAPPPPPAAAMACAMNLSEVPAGDALQGSSSIDRELIQGFQNFLKADAMVVLNAAPDEDGKVVISQDLGECSCVLLVAADKESVTYHLLPVGSDPSPAVSSRGLSLASPLAPGSFFMEKRTAKALKVGESFEIADQASVEWRAIDSVERLVAFFKAVCPTMLDKLSAWSPATWGGLDAAAKAKIWSANACHELHLFLCMKDPAFFKDAVLPFVQSKMERDVVDWFLLGDDAQLEPLLAPARFQGLNPLEQVLVIRRMAKKAELKVACERLVKALKAKALAFASKKIGATQRNALLDAVLSLEEIKQTDEWTMVGELADADVDIDMAEDFAAGSDSGSDACCDEDEVEEARPRARGLPAAPARRRAGGPHARSVGRFSVPSAPGIGAPGMPPGMFNVSAAETQSVMLNRAREPWEEVEGTKEYRETQYLVREERPQGKPASGDFAQSEFWADAAEHALKASDTELLLSPNFVFATSSPHEVAAAIALIDLPLSAETHSLVNREGLAASFEAASSCIFVAKEIVAVPSPEAGSDLGVAVRVYKAKLDETTSKDPRAMTEFIAGEPYCLQAIVTNVSPKELEAQVLIQIPEGALPVADSSYTRAQTARLPAFACLRVTACFYFPRPGQFSGAPVHCSVDGKAAAASTVVTYNVVATPSSAEVQAFSDILAAGEDAVLKFLQEADLLGGEKGFSFRQIHGLLRSPTFFRKATAALRERCIFDRYVWEYGFLHGDALACKEILTVTPDLHRRLGPYFDSPLVSVTAAEAEDFHLEYHPLVNKRAHRLNETAPRILNEQLRKTYEGVVISLARKCRPLAVADTLRLSYYLLCQDRVHEARELYQRVVAMQSQVPATGDLQLQMDYMAAYFDLFDPSSDHSEAHRIAKERSSCLHVQWRKRFEELAAVLAEIGGVLDPATGAVGSLEAAPALSATLHKGTLDIEASGLKEITIKFYSLDLEMLFSRMPFIKAETLRSEFSFVRPIYEETIPGSTATWQIPGEFRSMDLAVELVASKTLHVFQMHYASALRVAVAEQHGYLTVTNADGNALPATYVKVFCKTRTPSSFGGTPEQFFKDGYTDLRGRFDYASLSGESASKVDRFAILVASTKLGGIVREAPPPKRSG